LLSSHYLVYDLFNFHLKVVIIFPELNDKSDKVTIRGSKKDVDQCYKYLAQINKELLSNNYRVEVPIFKQFHKFIIGKEGANIKKVSYHLKCISGLRDSLSKIRDLFDIFSNDDMFLNCYNRFSQEIV
jgi:hypothetical protein